MPIPLIGPMLVEGVSQMLWDFGFRWHAELQTKWIDGVAGLGAVANFTENKPADKFPEQAEDFLMDTNPELLETIRNSSPEEKEALVKKLEKSFDDLQGLIKALKEH